MTFENLYEKHTVFVFGDRMQYFRISNEELMKVSDFRRFIMDNGYYLNLPDEMLYRYLVTSNYRMAPALSKILKMIVWRNENHIDTLLQDVYAMKLTSILQRKIRFCEYGHDKLHRPLTIIRIGAFELREVLKEYEFEDILCVFHYYTEYMEQKCKQISKIMGRHYTGNTTLMDMEGLSLKRHLHPKAVSIFKALVLANTYYYPESCQEVFVINPPPIFSFFWDLIKPLMNELQFTKLKTLDNVEELFEYYDRDQLPVEYNGTCQNHLNNILFDNAPTSGTKREGVITVPPQKEGNFQIKVEEGDYIIVNFSTIGADICYSAYSFDENERHDYCTKRCVSSNGLLVNVSFVIVTSGTFVMNFSSLESQVCTCTIGYELSIEYNVYYKNRT